MQRRSRLYSAKRLKTLAPRAELPRVSNFNGLRCQTILKVGFGAKGFSGALSNQPRLTQRVVDLTNQALDPSVDPAHLQLRPLNGASLQRGNDENET
jgi:hypothetical protein